MLIILALIVQWRLASCVASLGTGDNRISTDEIVGYRIGQPEEEIPSDLPTDDDAYNELKSMLKQGSPVYFVSSFPEIDARGFHESIFDNMDNYISAGHRFKKYESPISVSARGFYGDIFTDGFGSFHPVKRNQNSARLDQLFGEFIAKSAVHNRQKRWSGNPDKVEVISNNNTSSPNLEQNPCYQNDSENCMNKNNTSNNFFSPTEKKNESNHAHTSKTALNTQAINSWKKIGRNRHRLKRNIHSSNYPLNSYPYVREERRPEMDESGFSGNVFHRDQFTGFDTLRKRSIPGTDPLSYTENSVNDLILDYYEKPSKRVLMMDTKGFNGDEFSRDFGRFEPLRKRRDYYSPFEMDRYQRKQPMNVFSGDAFHQDFGAFNTLKRMPDSAAVNLDAFYTNFGNFETLRKRDYPRYLPKRKPLAGAELHDDAFSNNFGNFETLRKRDDNEDDYVLYLEKRKPSPAAELHGDAFHSSFGNFDTMKRAPLHTGFSGDAFHNNFGHFETLKRDSGYRLSKRKPEMDANGFNGDVFHAQFGNFDTLKKRSPSQATTNFRSNLFNSKYKNFNRLNEMYNGNQNLKNLFNTHDNYVRYSSEAESRSNLTKSFPAKSEERNNNLPKQNLLIS